MAVVGLGGVFATASGYLTITRIDERLEQLKMIRSNFSYLNSELKIDKKEKIFVPGEIICGSFDVKITGTEVPPTAPVIYGLAVHLECETCLKGFLKNTLNTNERIKFIYGKGVEPLGPLTVETFKFKITIPENSPPSFLTGKFGWIKYTLKCVATLSDKYSFTFEPLSVTIIPKSISQWENHKEYLEPIVFPEKNISSGFFFFGNILIGLKINQKCYQGGDEIKYVLNLNNSGEKNIHSATIQLEQTVHYNFVAGRTALLEKILLPGISNINGVASDCAQNWNGRLLIIPYLPPSSENCSEQLTIEFSYNLLVTLQMVGNLTKNIHSETFPIKIGVPLKASSSVSSGWNGNNYGKSSGILNCLDDLPPDYDTVVRG